MLREEDIRVDVGRANHGGDFMRLVHIPTGIERSHPGPLRNINRDQLEQQWLAEIEAEVKQRGLAQYIVPAYRTKSRQQRRKPT